MNQKAKEFKEAIEASKCPFCGVKMVWYDGSLGYEALRCYRCNFEVNHNGFGFINEHVMGTN